MTETGNAAHRHNYTSLVIVPTRGLFVSCQCGHSRKADLSKILDGKFAGGLTADQTAAK